MPGPYSSAPFCRGEARLARSASGFLDGPVRAGFSRERKRLEARRNPLRLDGAPHSPIEIRLRLRHVRLRPDLPALRRDQLRLPLQQNLTFNSVKADSGQTLNPTRSFAIGSRQGTPGLR